MELDPEIVKVIVNGVVAVAIAVVNHYLGARRERRKAAADKSEGPQGGKKIVAAGWLATALAGGAWGASPLAFP